MIEIAAEAKQRQPLLVVFVLSCFVKLGLCPDSLGRVWVRVKPITRNASADSQGKWMEN